MSAKFVQNGDIIDYTPVAATPAGSLVKIGDKVGVTKLDIPAGGLGALAMTGVYDIDVTALAAAKNVGDDVYLTSDGAVAFATATGSVKFGVIVAPAASGATVVRVRLG